ncbi:hypothetical protein DBV05_g11708 [Lasiodiplodia theobromae]|uniref:Uncharacterized protein n=1 Tax=Lasiodiplodia theobromae TaxID=45133 RepID=A0A5N5CWD7_9PEZI|nr:hypothetical protein DBV05_g11708 [Lasiodiplodia theobromae]
MFSKLRSKPQSTGTMHKPAVATKATPSRPAATKTTSSRPAERKSSFSEHQWDERQWTKPFTSATTQVMATLRFPPDHYDEHELRRIAEEENLYGKAKEHSRYHGSPKTGSSKHLSVSSKSTATAPSAKSSVSSFKSTAPSTKSTATLSSKGSASSLWSERPSSSSSNATYATSWSVDSSASTVMTDLSEAAFECNSNRPDSCTLGDFDVYKLRSKRSGPHRPGSTVSSMSGTSCAGTINSRPMTGKSSKSGDITFQVVAEEDEAIYLQRTPVPRPTRRFR